MGSKGTTTQTGQSTYTANPAIQNAGTQALGMAQSAATQPFQLPVQQYAGFNPQQQSAFDQTQQFANAGQPYFQQANQLFNQSAQPLTSGQINNYLNPYASNVMSQLSNIQGQQMAQVTGGLTQQAGGVGGDRIAVGQSELANQQNLASGQTLAGIYGQALTAAQQNQQMQQGSAMGLGNLGATAQNSALSGAQANYGMGAQQQGLAQNQLNAQYANTLAQLAYPYQNAQFLAGITGGLSGALGGTTDSNQQTTPAQPSIYSQILGAGVGAAGIYGALIGSGSGSTGGTGIGATSMNGQLTTPQQVPGFTSAASGGRIGYDDGGAVIPGQGQMTDPGNGSMVSPTSWMDKNNYIPTLQVQSHVQQPQVHFATPAAASSGPSLGDITKAVGQIAPLLMAADGGAVGASPFAAFHKGGHYADGGDVLSYADPTADQGPVRMFNTSDPNNPYAAWRKDASAGVPPPPTGSPSGGPPGSDSNDSIDPFINTLKKASTAPQDLSAMRGIMQGNQGPYPDNPAQSTSRDMSANPWMALAQAGFATMGGTSPWAGVNIGQGATAGIKALQDQRKELREEQTVNQRAKQLSIEAQKHIDDYSLLKPSQQAEAADKAGELLLKKQQIEQAGWQKTDFLDGTVMYIKPGDQEGFKVSPDGNWVKLSPQEISKAKGAQTGGNNPSPTGAPPTKPEDKPAAPDAYNGVKELGASNEAEKLPTPTLPKTAMPMVTQATKKINDDLQKKAIALPDLQNNLISMKAAYATLMADGGKDGFFTKLLTTPGQSIPGYMQWIANATGGHQTDTVGARIEYAKQLNTLASQQGKEPYVDPHKLAAAEEMAKIQSRMGAAFAGQINSRPAFQMEKIGINATPGISTTPQGFLAIMPGFDAAVHNTKDQIEHWADYQQKNPFSPSQWMASFMKTHTPDYYYARSVIENIPDKRLQTQLPKAVEELKKDPRQANIDAFNKAYHGTASYFLTGKMDTYQPQ